MEERKNERIKIKKQGEYRSHMSGKTYRIGDVAKMLGIATSKLRFWEDEISYVRPMRTDKGQRYYSEKDVDLLKRIQYLLDKEKLTIPGTIQALKRELYGKSSLDKSMGTRTSVSDGMSIRDGTSVNSTNTTHAMQNINDAEYAEYLIYKAQGKKENTFSNQVSLAPEQIKFTETQGKTLKLVLEELVQLRDSLKSQM